MSNSSNYPAPPVLNCEQRQIMLGLAYLAYTGEGITTPSPETQIKEEITTALPLVTYTPPGGTISNLGNWHIVWGPVAYTVPGSAMQDNLMYVAQNGTTSQYAIAIRGTNFASEVDWLLEDFNVINTMNWPLNTTTSSPSGAMINESASIDMNILLSMVDSVTTTKTLQDYLLTITSSEINICVTGHSLGGMLSSTLALNLLETQGDKSIWDASGLSTVCFISFAGPTAGNNTFATYSNSVFANAKRPPAELWDVTMNTNGDVVSCSYDIAPMAYTGTNIYNFQMGSAGAMFSIYQDNINFANLTYGEKDEWSIFQEYILSKLGGLTNYQQYTSLALANNLSAILGVFNGTPPPSSSGKFTEYLAAFMSQAVWQHSNSYPNIFGMQDTLLGTTTQPSVINRNVPTPAPIAISLSSIASNPSEIKRDHTVVLTLTGSGFSSFVSPKMIPTEHLLFSDFVLVNDTTITVTVKVSATADDTENIGVEGFTGVGQVSRTQELPITVHFF
jgi:hypothetical protein